MKIKCPVLTCVGIIAILGGFGLIIYGLTFVAQGYVDVKIESVQKTPIKLDDNLLSAQIIEPELAKEADMAKSLKINFDTIDIFQGDEIGVTVSTIGVKPYVALIYVIIADPSFDMNMTTRELVQQIEQGKKYRNVIELNPYSNPPFYARQIVPFPQPHQEVVFYATVLHNDGTHERLITNQIFTTVLSKVDKLQAETNMAILQQIDETKISNAQQEQTNKIFMGVSWIGVAIAPMLAGVDILLRIRFDSH